MPPPRQPSKVDTITFPVFGLSWFGIGSLPPNNQGVSILAYCGGGGSAKTGVGNSIFVLITTGGGTIVQKRQIKIDTGEQICVGVAIALPPQSREARLLAAVGDELILYGLPLHTPSEDENGTATVLGTVTTGKKYGCNAVAFSPLQDVVAVGCENGLVLTYSLSESPDGKTVQFEKLAECPGHAKAVCAVTFHPRGKHVLSSAKDGTARIWDAQRGGNALCLLKCSIEDPAKPPPKLKKGARVPQVLVRGCAYGDLEGRIIYTVASGRRGAAFLGKWKSVPVPGTQGGPPGGPPDGSTGPGGPGTQPIQYQEVARTNCSPVPVSAMSLSGDASVLALGGVDGTITLLNVETMVPAKKFDAVHDLPVTGIAARPVPLPLPGEEAEGVSYDAISASADNRLASLTLQRRRRKVKPPPGQHGAVTQKRGTMFYLFELWFLMVVLLIGYVMKLSYELCESELVAFQLEAAQDCVWHTVLWAPPTRPGILVPPH